jgi:hypothetical protein
MSRMKYVIPAAILMAVFGAGLRPSYGKPEYTKSTKKPCTFCHVDFKAKPKELTEAGKYYKEHHSLEGYTK